MKKQAFVATALSMVTAVSAAVLLAQKPVNASIPAAQFPATTVAINATNFPDENFRKVVKTFDDGDNKLTAAEISAVTNISAPRKDIADLTGVEYFTSLTSLVVYGNKLTALNVSNNLNLTELNCWGNQISTLDVTLNTALTKLVCSENKLAKLNVTKNTALETLYCHTNQIQTLNLSKNKALKNLDCSNNPITTLNLQANTKLVNLECQNLPVSELDLSKNTLLEKITCTGIQVNELNLSALSHLSSFLCYSAPNCTTFTAPSDKSNLLLFILKESNVKTIDLSGASNMTRFRAADNALLTKVNLTGCTSLLEIDVSNDSKLATFQLGSHPNLQELFCASSNRTTLDVSAYPELRMLDCGGNKFTTLDLSKNTKIHTLDCSQGDKDTACTKIKVLNVTGLDNLSSIRCKYNDISVLDTTNKDLYELKCTNNKISKLDLSSSVSLQRLDCEDNLLTSLDLSAAPDIYYVKCGNNKLTSLTFHEYSQLDGLECYNNKLKKLDLSTQTDLGFLSCSNNEITTLSIQGAKLLRNVQCSNNAITSLDISGCTYLEELDCRNNNLKSLVLTGDTKLKSLRCSGNNLTKLDLSGFTLLDVLMCQVNSLTSLNISDCPDLRMLDCYANNIKTINIDNCTKLVTAAKDYVFIATDNYEGQVYEVINYFWDEGNIIKAAITCDVTTGVVSKSLTPTPTPMAKPSNFKAVAQSPTTIKVSWDAVPGAQKYNFAYYALLDGSTVDSNREYIYVEGTSYILNDAVPGATYHFKIAAYYNNPRFPNPIAEVSVTTPSITDISVELGKTYKYSIKNYSASDIKWSVGNTAVATVDSTGLITAKSYGNTYLYVGLPNGTTIKCLVRVVYPALKINYTEKTLHINQTFQFSASNVYGQKITWSVGNTSVATVDTNGKVTGKSAANTYLYAKSADGRVAKCLLKVIDPGTLGINYTEKTVYLGQSFTFTAKNAGILTPTWSVGNTSVAKVNSNGKVTSVSVGNTYLYVKTADGRSARCLVKVVDPGPLNITYTEKTIKVGSTFQFAAKNPAGQTVSWRVGNTAVATVDANGKVTGKSAANTWLYASTPDGREVKCLLKIVA